MVESARFTAIDIASDASTESLDRYGQNLNYYIENNYTYIPMPEDGKYYDRDEGILKDIEDQQKVDEDDSLVVVLDRLQDFPFLLIKRHKREYFEISEGDEEGSQEGEDSESEDGELEDEEEDESQNEPYVYSKITVPPEYSVDRDDNEFLEDYLTAKEVFNQYPEVGTRELDSLYSIITLPDLNRRTVKQIAYPTIADLADKLSQKIQSEYSDSEDLYPQLKPVTIGNWVKDKQNGLDVHIAEYINLTEIKQIISSSGDDFVAECGFQSKTKCRDKLGSVNELRKKVMHANRTLVHNQDDLQDVLRRIEIVQNILKDIKK